MEKHIGIIIGPNGVGKGTLAQMLAEDFRYYHINMGQLFRDWIAAHAKHEHQSDVDNGVLIDDTFVREVVTAKFEELKRDAPTVNLVMEGLPRTVAQVDIVKDLCRDYGYNIKWVIVLSATLEMILDRVMDRVIAPDGTIYNLKYNPPPSNITREQLSKRADDRPEVITKRYESYIVDTFPVLSDPLFLNAQILNIDASKTIREVHDEARYFLRELEIEDLSSL